MLKERVRVEELVPAEHKGLIVQSLAKVHLLTKVVNYTFIDFPIKVFIELVNVFLIKFLNQYSTRFSE